MGDRTTHGRSSKGLKSVMWDFLPDEVVDLEASVAG